ncbi:MAG TPA: DUF1499 domain-containing protein [Gammaproteobacteria bacterium]
MKSIQEFLVILAMLLAFVSLIGAFSSGTGVRFGFWEFRTGFGILRWSVYAAGAAVVLSLVAVMLAKPAGVGFWDLRIILAFIIGAAVIAVPYFTVKEFRKIPTVADATTDMEDPPQFVALIPLRQKTAKNPLQYRYDEASALQRQYFPDLTGFSADKKPAEIIAAAKVAALAMGLEIVDAVPEEGRLEATDTTFWFGFKDDVIVRARPQADGRTQVDIRSASRVGRLDGGVNGKRVQRLLQMMK